MAAAAVAPALATAATVTGLYQQISILFVLNVYASIKNRTGARTSPPTIDHFERVTTSIASQGFGLATGHHEWPCKAQIGDTPIKALRDLWSLSFLLDESVIFIIDPAPYKVVQRARSTLVE